MARFACVVAFISLTATECLAAEYYVSPGGSAQGAGRRADPWDIVSALSGQKSVKPGDTVWLGKGTYRCEEAYRTKNQGYQVNLQGSAAKPIVIRAVQGDRAVIDGGMLIRGDHLWLRDLEIAQPDSLPRVVQEGGSHPDLGNPSGGLTIHGGECHLINLLIQNNLGNGVGWWSSAKGGENRAHLVIFNWNNESEISLPSQGWLTDGQRYQLRDPLDFWGEPVMTGQCKGNNIAVPLQDEFAVFVVQKG